MKLSFQAAGKNVIEALLVLALILLAFLVIALTLNSIFPSGQSLFDLVIRSEGSRDPTDGGTGSRELRLVTTAGEDGQGKRATAVLTRKERSVKSKRAAQIAWTNASEGMLLYNRDAIQTFDRSGATLSFTGDHFLELGENSLVVLRKLDRDIFLRENRTVVVLMGGQLTGGVKKGVKESFNLEVVAPGAVARVPSRGKMGQSARFQMAVRQDDSSVLTVLEGSADLVLEEGSMEVGPNQIVKIQPGQSPVYLSKPPGSPVLTSPEEGTIFLFRDISPTVSFAWVGPQGISQYRFALSRDPEFDRVVYDDTIRDNRFSHGNLKAGDYFWRVSSATSDWGDRFSAVGHFKLVQDLDPPVLQVHYPEGPVGSDVLKLTGTTEPGARVFVSGLQATINEHGDFIHSVPLKPGSNIIVVEAVDKVGNVTYFSQIVDAEF